MFGCYFFLKKAHRKWTISFPCAYYIKKLLEVQETNQTGQHPKTTVNNQISIVAHSHWIGTQLGESGSGSSMVAPSNLRGLFPALVLPQSSSLSDSESITLKSELQKQHQKTKLIKKNSYAGSNFKFMFPTWVFFHFELWLPIAIQRKNLVFFQFCVMISD